MQQKQELTHTSKEVLKDTPKFEDGTGRFEATPANNTSPADLNRQNQQQIPSEYSQPQYNQPFHPYQYPPFLHQQQPWFNPYTYPYPFPQPPFGYPHPHRGHHWGHRGHHRGYQGFRGHYGRRGRGYHRHQGSSSGQDNYANQIPPQNGYPSAPMFPPAPNGNQFNPPPPPFNMPPPMPFNCPPPHPFSPFTPLSGELPMRGCHRDKKRDRSGKHKGRKHKRDSSSGSRSRSGSSSSSSSQQSKYSRKAMKKAESIKYDEEITQYYSRQMNDFMESRQINQKQREKIIRVLKKKFPAYDAPVFDIRQYLEIIEKQNLTFKMSYVKIIKVLLKCEFDLAEAIPKIQKIQYHKLKKYDADRQFNDNYGEQQQTPLLQVNDLILMHSNNQKILYLVDGNNILPTHKHLRKYFQSKQTIEKVFAQIRTRWYISHCFQKEEVILFFDQKYEDKDYELASKCIFPSSAEQEKALEVTVIYGEGKKADEKIIEKLVQLSSSTEKAEIVLVSADRDLNMRCQLIKPILHTSGKYFFKYCKYCINRKYKGEKKMKQMAKGIAQYDQYKY